MTSLRTSTIRHARLPLLPLVVLTALAALLLAPLSGLAALITVTSPSPIPVTGTLTLVNGSEGTQTDPHVSGTLVSYTSIVSSSSEIRYHDLAKGEDRAIPRTTGVQDSLSDVSGSTIVFRRIDGTSTRRIMAFDTATPDVAPVELNPVEGSRRGFAAIGGRSVAWQEFDPLTNSVANITVVDLNTGNATALTNDTDKLNRQVAVSPDDSLIAWSTCATTGTGCDIYAAQKTADGTWGEAALLAGSPGEDVLPDTNGEVVVYASNAGGDYDIRWRDLASHSDYQLTMSGEQQNPNISGNLISFESTPENIVNADLFIYDLATGSLYQVTNTPDVDETLNDVLVGADGTVRVVWAHNDGTETGTNVYALSFAMDGDIYEICPLFDQSRAYPLKSTVPIRLQLCDTTGQNLSSSSLVLTATELVKKDDTSASTLVEDAGDANPDSNFRYDETLEGYVFNLSTKGLSTGTWELRFSVTDDPTTYRVSFDLR